jgi:hypothetical protein
MPECCTGCEADIRAVRLAYREYPEILDDERNRRFWAQWFPAVGTRAGLERAREDNSMRVSE